MLARNNRGDVGMKIEWAEAIKAGKTEIALSNFNHAGNFTEAILMGNIAMKVGEGFDWNADKPFLQQKSHRAGHQGLSEGLGDLTHAYLFHTGSGNRAVEFGLGR